MLSQASRVFEDVETATLSSGDPLISVAVGGDIDPPDGSASALQCTVSMSASGILRLRMTGSTTTFQMPLNNNVALVADALYTFTTPIPRQAAQDIGVTYSYNYTYSVSSSVNFIVVDIIRGAPVSANPQGT